MAHPKILIVDDRVENLVTLETLLADFPAQTVRAISGNEALALTLEHDFALVLLDVQMPVMDGFEVARLLHQSAKTRHLPIIFLSAVYSGDIFHVKGVEAGAIDFIEKPIIPELLRGKVRLFLELHQYRKQLVDLSSREIVTHVSDGVLIVNRSAEVLLANPAAERLLGVAGTPLVGSQFDYPLVVKKLQEISLPTASGESLDVEMNVSLMQWSDDDVYIVSLRDITARKMAEAAQRELEYQLRQKYKMEAVGVMAGGMAHNFNNSLSIVLGNLDLLSHQKNLTDEAKQFVKNAKTGVLSSRDLIKQIMVYSRSGPSELLPVQLSTVINETQKLLRSTIPTSIYLQYKVTHEGQNATVLADATQLQEALLNLCNNAVHAMDEKGTLTISLDTVDLQWEDIPPESSHCSPGRFVCLSVKDTGCGMSSKLMERIFDPFYTTKAVGEGTGMGLSTVQGMIKQVGGLIKVRSILEQGTTFELFFPITDQVLSDSIGTKEQQIPTGTEQILLVDDDEMLARLAERMLSELGYQVTTMTSSVEALKLFTANADAFDLVLTDQTMPDLLGSDLLQEMIKIKPALPCILCTGYSSKVSAEETEKLSISAFLMKPFEQADLARTIRKALDKD